MNASNRWVLVVAVLGFFLLAALIPIAFLLGRSLSQPGPTPIVQFPTATINFGASPTEPPATDLPAVTPTSLPSLTPLPTSTPLPTNTPLPTSTPLPTNTPLPTHTFTPVPPTKTPTPSIPCNAAAFVADVTIPSGALVASGDKFDKIWRIKNIGSCTWSTSYKFTFVGGTDMVNEKYETVNLPHAVKPGETVDIQVKLIAPAAGGTYTANWLLVSNTGGKFGTGAKADAPFIVKIQVLKVDPAVAFDMSLKVCEAAWENSNDKKLACPGSATGTDGFVVVLSHPSMEHRNDDEPALWINPDHRSGGEVAGLYPVYQVKAGDRFRSTIGCLADTSGCSVTFELMYKKGNGNVFSLGTWTESFDGSVTELDIDLAELAGQNVQFILVVRVNNQKFDKANAFWFAPRVVNEP